MRAMGNMEPPVPPERRSLSRYFASQAEGVTIAQYILALPKTPPLGLHKENHHE
jgi:hypothetical protein